jgi:hypothetical protein
MHIFTACDEAMKSIPFAWMPGILSSRVKYSVLDELSWAELSYYNTSTECSMRRIVTMFKQTNFCYVNVKGRGVGMISPKRVFV